MSHGSHTHLVIRSALAVALSLAIYEPVRAQSAPPPQETPAPAPAAPMTTMTPASTSQGARQAASMTEMMGAPGLVPFDVMTGQAGKWMVGYQFMVESMDGSLVGIGGTTEAKTLEHFFAAPTDMSMQMQAKPLIKVDQITAGTRVVITAVEEKDKTMTAKTIEVGAAAAATKGMP